MAGQYGTVALSDEAATYFQRHRCRGKLLPPEAILVWNQAEGAVKRAPHSIPSKQLYRLDADPVFEQAR